MDKQERLKLIAELRQIIYPVPIRFDGLMSAMLGEQVINFIALDDSFAIHDAEYNNKLCTYKDKERVSMMDYVLLKYGERVVYLLNVL